MTHVAVVIGTRPEAIKLAPVLQELRRREWTRVSVIGTAQHRHLLDQVLELFRVKVDVDLDIMRPNQSLPELTARLFLELSRAYDALAPDVVLAQGDTTTVFVAATVAHYKRIWFGHVEAGLRSGRLYEPFPEEFNRRAAALVADAHFAPTAGARDALIAEGIDPARIELTGNTVVDALMEARRWRTHLPFRLDPRHRHILLTAHRRENFGAPMDQVFSAVRRLLDTYPDIDVIYPVHPNPNVQLPAQRALGNHERVALLDPLPYDQLVAVMNSAHMILTDSGGIQEEAPALGKPVLVLRNTTERPEAVNAGCARLVGTDEEMVFRSAAHLLDDELAYRRMSNTISPYGDGLAARRIVDCLERTFETSAWRDRTSCPPLAAGIA